MIKNHFKIAWRNLRKHKFHTMLNVVGLACGLSFTLIIGAYIWQESTYNGQLNNLDHQLIIQSEWKSPEMGLPITTLAPLPRALKEEYPDLVRNYYRFDGLTCILSHGDKVYSEETALGDSTFLSMYGMPFLYGDAATALKEPSSVVITDEIAIKYFGRIDVLGEQIDIKNFAGEKRPFTITAVMDRTTSNSVVHLNESLNNKIFLSTGASDFFGRDLSRWDNPFIIGFIELQPGITKEMLAKPLQDLLHKHADESIASNLTPTLHPLSAFHLEKDNGLLSRMLWTLGLTAGFILFMAIINFVNISVQGATSRLKEIGVRKVMGSSRQQLGLQFIGESILMVIMAFAIALLLYPLISPLFTAILGKNLPKIDHFPLSVWMYTSMACLLIGAMAGLYPAIRLSGLKTVHSVKGKISPNWGNASFLKSLIGFQFVIALGVFMASGIISRQVSLFFGNKLGYDKESLVTLKVPRDWSEAGLSHMKAIQQTLMNLPHIEQISLSYDVPGGQGLMSSGTLKMAKETGEHTTGVSGQYIRSDMQFAETYKIPLLAGKFLDDNIDPQLAKIVINEHASKLLGFDSPDATLNQRVYLKPNDLPATIIGVTKDFYATSMRDPLGPIVWTNIKADNIFRFFTVRLKSGNLATHLASLESEWRGLLPDAPFEYKFMDENIDRLYRTEMQLKNATYAATALAVVIVLLGIVGLVSLDVQKRKKEIGIRKVLGANVFSVITLFIKELSLTFTIAISIACPLVYLFMDKWLNNYHMRIGLGPTYFILPILLLASMAALFIGLQTWRIAKANPVESLRDE